MAKSIKFDIPDTGKFFLTEEISLSIASTENDGNTDMIIGVNYRPEKGLTITPNLRTSTPDEGDATTMFMLNFEFKF